MAQVREGASDTITYLERPGPGPVMVLLHGIGSNAASFRDLLEMLPEDQRVIAWNAPGYGGSQALAAPWPVPGDYANALAGFLNRLGIKTATIVGHSLGTLIGAAFAAAYPERTSRLVLASCACGYRVPIGTKLPGNIGARIEELELQGADAFAAERAPRLVFEPRLNPDIVERVRLAMSQVDRVGYGQAVRTLASGDLPALMARVRTGAGFIIGINDRVTPEQQTLDAALAWSKANGTSPQIIRISRAGHAVYLQKPSDFIDALASLASATADADRHANAATMGSER